MTEQITQGGARVIVIGAGLTGLSCAVHLKKAGHEVRLIDHSDRVGGRVQTDLDSGFQLDHGFQVLQTAYPEAKALLDYKRLDLHPFDPGALIAHLENGSVKLIRMSDPWRRPGQALQTFFNGIGTYMDRFKLGGLRLALQRDHNGDYHDHAADEAYRHMSTMTYLKERLWLSDDLIERFIRPWFSGVFLENDLATSAAVFRFVFRMLALGDASLPKAGMAAIPQQLAAHIGPASIQLNTQVMSLADGEITLRHIDGSTRTQPFDQVLVAIDEFSVPAFMTRHLPEYQSSLSDDLSSRTHGACATTCLYFASPKSPDPRKMLILNAGKGLVNNFCVPSNVCSSYAPAGQSLISASVIGRQSADIESVLAYMRLVFGSEVDRWRHLKTFEIPNALPVQLPRSSTIDMSPRRLNERVVLVNGLTSSINACFKSGRVAAAMI